MSALQNYGNSATFRNVEFIEHYLDSTVKKHSRRYRGYTHTAQSSDNVLLTDEAEDSSAFPGIRSTENAIRELHLRESIKKLISSFIQEGLSWSFEQEELKISSTTGVASIAFFENLPLGTILPQVSPDDEGGLVMVWNELLPDPILVIVDEWKLHLIKAAGTQHAEHLPNIPFDGESIPKAVLDVLPRKSLA